MMKNNKAFTLLDLLILVIVVGGFALLAFPKYFWELEKSKALAVNTFLFNAVIAENDVYTDTRAFTQDWNELTPFLVMPSAKIARVSQPDNHNDRFFELAPGKKQADGFNVGLLVGEEKQSGSVSAVRSGSALYEYTLVRTFPEGTLSCLAENKRSVKFCERFLAYDLDLTADAGLEAPAPDEARPEAESSDGK